MIVPFAKYHGAGNDFIVIDDHTETFPASNSNLIQFLCQRHVGIGADGLLLFQKSKKADARMRIFNSDGKEVSMCGNGLRCFVDFIYQLKLIGAKSAIEVGERIIECEWKDNEITVDLGPYEWMPTELAFNSLRFQLVNTGVPHAITFVENDDYFSLASQIRFHPSLGEEGANVNFAILRENKLYVRTYERGVEGETLSCGSGAAAVAIAAKHNYHLSNPIMIIPRSGEELKVDVLPSSLRLSGKATFVFHGSFECVN